MNVMSFLQMTLSGGVLILVIALLRAVFINRLPKRTFLVLWTVAILRLLVPFAIPSPISLPSLFSSVFPHEEEVTAEENVSDVSLEEPIGDMEAQGQFVRGGVIRPVPLVELPEAEPTEEQKEPFDVTVLLPYLWLAGVLLCAAAYFVPYGRTSFVFRTAFPVENDFVSRWQSAHPMKRRVRVRQSDRMNTPLTYGTLRPVLLLPKNIDWTDEETLSYIFLHEYDQIRRFDTL